MLFGVWRVAEEQEGEAVLLKISGMNPEKESKHEQEEENETVGSEGKVRVRVLQGRQVRLRRQM